MAIAGGKNIAGKLVEGIDLAVCPGVPQGHPDTNCHSSKIVITKSYPAHKTQASRTIRPIVTGHSQSDLRVQPGRLETNENTAVISRKYRRITPC